MSDDVAMQRASGTRRRRRWRRAILAAVAACGALAVLPSSAMARLPGVLVNPGFESVCVGNVLCAWSGQTTPTVSTDAHSGSTSALLAPVSAGSFASDCILLPAAAQVDVTFWVKVLAGDTGTADGGAGTALGRGVFYTDAACGTGVDQRNVTAIGRPPLGTWTQIPTSTQDANGARSMRLMIMMGCSALDCRMVFDDVALTVTTTNVPCGAGSFSATGDEPCTLAPAGSYVDAAGATSATPCAAGFFSAVAGAVACTSAPAGSYVDAPGATSATLCPAGFYSAAAGAVACSSAPPGAYAPTAGSTTVLACPAGSYSPTAGAVACTPAPAGSYVSTAGSATVALCPVGYFSTGGAVACTAAPAGSYVASPGSGAAALCPAGFFSASIAAVACVSAPAGSYVPSAGSSSALQCAAGTFSTGSAVACTPAPLGSYVPSAGASSATLCLAGSFSAATGALACTLAPAGSFVAAPGSSSATLCPPGSFSAATGALACTLAPIGSFVATTGATAATPCPTGSTTSAPGATSCTPTSVGYRFGGFLSPVPGRKTVEAGSSLKARFVLLNAAGLPLSPRDAKALSEAGKVRVSLSGPGASTAVVASASCEWSDDDEGDDEDHRGGVVGSVFECELKTPKSLRTGAANPYRLTALVKVGSDFVAPTAVAGASNPVTVTFK